MFPFFSIWGGKKPFLFVPMTPSIASASGCVEFWGQTTLSLFFVVVDCMISLVKFDKRTLGFNWALLDSILGGKKPFVFVPMTPAIASTSGCVEFWGHGVPTAPVDT